MPIGRGGGPDSLITVEPSAVDAPAVQFETVDAAPAVSAPVVDTHEGWVLGS